MAAACDTPGGEEKCIQNFSGKPEGKNYMENLGVMVKMILIWILK